MATRSIADLANYNTWVLDIGGEASEQMTASEHFEDILWMLHEMKLQTYPLWGALIALLPPGETKEEAQRKFATGCIAACLDPEAVKAEWTVVERAP